MSDKPDFVNELGVKWWLDRSATSYARKPDLKGTTMDVLVYRVEHPNGASAFIVTDGGGEPMKECPSLEAVGAWVDFTKAAKRFDEGEAK